MGKEFTLGRTKKSLMVNGHREKNMDMEFGKELKEILILENGGIQKQKDMEFTLGKMVGTKI
jgi:hypothetical protein